VVVWISVACGEQADEPRAVIIDQLALTQPNQDFVRQATQILTGAQYGVDYVPGEGVTVDYFRDLGKHDYDVVLVRAHAGLHQGENGQFTDETAIFTGEAYSSSSHVDEQRNGSVTQVLYDETSEELLFGIAPSFVRHEMNGNFDEALVVLMGCDVLRGELLADSFVDRGAAAVVGWDGPVSAAHTDAATLALLQRVLVDGMSFAEATAATSAEVGPDPYYGATLVSASE
jgi:hypothetical protein